MDYTNMGIAVIGVLFHEAIRIYKVIGLNNSIIPDIAVRRKSSWIIYLSVIFLFCVVAVVASTSLGNGNSITSIWLGFSIPLGFKFTAQTSSNNEGVDDLNSQLNIPISTRVKDWIFEYSK